MSVSFGHGVYNQSSRWLKELLAPDMSARMFFLDFYVYPAAVIVCLGFAFGPFATGLPWSNGVIVVSGYVSWTLVEYISHRFILHHVKWFRSLHDAHHGDPHGLIGTPTVVSLAIFYGLGYLPVAEIWGKELAAAWLAGLLTGYLAYISVHYAVHHFGSHGFRLLKRLKRQHALHHHASQARNFGVTTAFWDMIFLTAAK